MLIFKKLRVVKIMTHNGRHCHRTRNQRINADKANRHKFNCFLPVCNGFCWKKFFCSQTIICRVLWYVACYNSLPIQINISTWLKLCRCLAFVSLANGIFCGKGYLNFTLWFNRKNWWENNYRIDIIKRNNKILMKSDSFDEPRNYLCKD